MVRSGFARATADGEDERHVLKSTPPFNSAEGSPFSVFMWSASDVMNKPLKRWASQAEQEGTVSDVWTGKTIIYDE